MFADSISKLFFSFFLNSEINPIYYIFSSIIINVYYKILWDKNDSIGIACEMTIRFAFQRRKSDIHYKVTLEIKH